MGIVVCALWENRKFCPFELDILIFNFFFFCIEQLTLLLTAQQLLLHCLHILQITHNRDVRHASTMPSWLGKRCCCCLVFVQRLTVCSVFGLNEITD